MCALPVLPNSKKERKPSPSPLKPDVTKSFQCGFLPCVPHLTLKRCPEHTPIPSYGQKETFISPSEKKTRWLGLLRAHSNFRCLANKTIKSGGGAGGGGLRDFFSSFGTPPDFQYWPKTTQTTTAKDRKVVLKHTHTNTFWERIVQAGKKDHSEG